MRNLDTEPIDFVTVMAGRQRMTANTLTYTARFWRQVSMLAVARGTNIRALARQLCAREIAANQPPSTRRSVADDPATLRPVPTTTHTLTFPAGLYERIKDLAERREISVRELIRRVFRAEVERALRRREVSGAQFEGPIGEHAFDVTQPQASRHRRQPLTGA